MHRIEIICDATIGEDLRRELETPGAGLYYTSVYPVQGRGLKGARLGTTVWPEENMLYSIYTDDSGLELVQRIIDELRSSFPNNGLAAFSVADAHEL